MSYYDLHDILAQETPTSVVFLNQVLGLGHLDQGNPDENLASGTKLQLPLWLSSILHREGYVEMELPKQYGRNFRSRLAADAKVVRLGSKPYFYEVGCALARIFPSESADLTAMLVSTFADRFLDIFNLAQNWRGEDMSDLRKRLSEAEQQLFRSEYVACTQWEAWKDRPMSQLRASQFAQLEGQSNPVLQGAESETKRRKGPV